MGVLNNELQIRLHGRGGQGVVFAATSIAEAANREGKYVQSFGIYGAERRGAPVTSFVRIGVCPDMPRCQIQQPEIVVVFDVNLRREQFLKGLKSKGKLLLNYSNDQIQSFCRYDFETWLVDASCIAVESGLGSVGIPIINTVMLGALIRISNVASLQNLLAVAEEKIPHKTQKNLHAIQKGYDGVRGLRCFHAE